jgi:protein phosphatase 2C family protein 2/3
LTSKSSKQLDQASNTFYFGLFDGHSGVKAAQACQSRLHSQIADKFGKTEQFVDALKHGFCSLDDEILQEVAPDPSGCTAICVFVSSKFIYVANSGDSRAVLSRAGAAIELSKDHKPSVSDEKSRIECSGGSVEFSMLNGMLGVSRAFGGFDADTQSKLRGLTASPDVVKHALSDEDEFVVVACDGLWDVVSSEDAVRIVRDNIRRTNDYNDAAEVLLQTALKRASEDNVTVGIIGFNRLVRNRSLLTEQSETSSTSTSTTVSKQDLPSGANTVKSQRPRFNFSCLAKALNSMKETNESSSSSPSPAPDEPLK